MASFTAQMCRWRKTLLLLCFLLVIVILNYTICCFRTPHHNDPTGLDETGLTDGEKESRLIHRLYQAMDILAKEYKTQEFLRAAAQLKVLTTRQFPAFFRPLTCNACNVMDFNVLINPQNLCHRGTRIVDLLIVLTTIPGSITSRMMVRKTWATFSKENTANIRYVFLYGSGWSEEEQSIIDAEHATYGDVLQHDYKDAYYNLSYKVVTAYKWAFQYCSHAKFILRSADDNYLNLPAIITYINKEKNFLQRVQVGHVVDKMRVIRQRNVKFYVSFNEYPYELYPPYAVGSAFLYSMPAAREVVAASADVPFFAMEDAWFGMVMIKIKMEVKNEEGFDELLKGALLDELLEHRCPLGGKFFSIHWVNARAMEKLWKLCQLNLFR